MKINKSRPWKKLTQHAKNIKKRHLRDFFEDNPSRADEFSIKFDNLYFDYSKNNITDRTLKFLFSLAKTAKLDRYIQDMFNGEKINFTENRPVLHVALRNRSNRPIYVDGKDIMPQINAVLDKMHAFSDGIRFGEITGYTGKKLTNIVNIGIGGSDLGPAMAVEALRKYWAKDIKCHFISNIDGTACAEVLEDLDPETTLFIVASKTFTTIETLTNARTCRKWLVDSLGEHAVAKHFVALSTNEKEVVKFGINPDNMFEFWDFVGGRYSMWSAIGLIICIAIGYENFEKMLDGAYAMDMHFLKKDFSKNIPVILGLIGIWNNNFLGYKRYAVVPYDQYLKQLPSYLQQLDMESNGKFLDRAADRVHYSTGPIIFGGAGTDVQHSFFQLIHQGTDIVPIDFIVPAISHNEIGDHQEILLANVLAQGEALMFGKTKKQSAEDLRKAGFTDRKYIKYISRFKSFDGNRPSNTFVFKKIDPYSLGMLIAMYEHKVFVQGIIWNIDSFDQMGVELGKQMALNILPELQGNASGIVHDSSTAKLIKYIKRLRK